MQNSLFSSHGCQLLLTWHGTSNFEVFCDGLKNVYFKLLTKWQASTLVVLFLDFSHSFLNLTSMAWNEIVLILNWGFIPFLRSFAIEFNILLWKQVPQFEILAKELTLGILPMYNIMITYFVCSRVEMYPLWVRPYLLFDIESLWNTFLLAKQKNTSLIWYMYLFYDVMVLCITIIVVVGPTLFL